MSTRDCESGIIGFCPAMLLACIAISPLYLARPDKGPALSPAYTYACLAFLAGQTLGRYSRVRAACDGRPRSLLLFFAALLIEVFVLPEWELLGSYASALFARKTIECSGLIGRLIFSAQIPALSLASAFAGIASASLLPMPDETHHKRGIPVSLLMLTMTAAYLPRAIWLALIPAGRAAGKASFSLATDANLAPLAMVAVLAYAGAVAVLILMWRRRHLPGAAFGTAYALGMLLWALLTRVAPLYEDLASSLAPVSALLVIALFTWPLSEAQRSPRRNVEVHVAAQAGPALPPQIADAGLTARELEVVESALKGNASSKIASELGISASTVRGTLAKAYKKVGVASLDQLKAIGESSEPSAAETSASGACDAAASRAAFRRIIPLALATLPLFPIAVVARGWGQGQSLLMGTGFALVVRSLVHLSVGGSADVRASSWRRTATTVLLAVADLVALAAVFCRSVQVTGLPGNLPGILEFGAGASVAFLLVGLRLEPISDAEGCAPPVPLAPSACIFFTLGLALEELWRLASGASGALGLLPFLLAAGYLLLACRAGSLAKRSLPRVPSAPDLSCLALGCGILAGVFAMNRLGDFLLAWQEALGASLRPSAFLCLAMMLASIPGLLSLRIIYQNTLSGQPTQAAPSSVERVEGFLVSRGLNSTETQTALLIAQDLTTRQIAARLSYSIGAINSARRSAYAKLNVRSKEDLLNLCDQFMDA